MSKTVSTRGSLVARLRKSREDFERAQYDDGCESGKRYAEREADYGELISAEGFEFNPDDSGEENRDALLHLVDPSKKGREWAEYFGEEYDYLAIPAYLGGFYEGMMEVWKDVRSEVEA
jgi:hypothetical protein